MNNVLPNLDVGKEGTSTLAVSHIQAVQVLPHGLDAKNAKKGKKVSKNVQNSDENETQSVPKMYKNAMEKEDDDDEQFVSYKSEDDLDVVRDEKLGEVTVYVNGNLNVSDDVVKVKEVSEQEKAFPELECTEKLSDNEEKKEMEQEYSDEHSSMKSNLEKLEDELKAEGNDGQWSVLEDIDTEVLNRTVGMMKDGIYQDEEDEFEYCNLAELDRLY